jgi:hypothetical protein
VAIVGGRSVNSITFSGPSALVRLGYQRAARLGPWRVEDGYLTAEVLEADGFRITQSGLTFEIQNPDGIPTVRPIADVRIYSGRLEARLIPKR